LEQVGTRIKLCTFPCRDVKSFTRCFRFKSMYVLSIRNFISLYRQISNNVLVPFLYYNVSEAIVSPGCEKQLKWKLSSRCLQFPLQQFSLLHQFVGSLAVCYKNKALCRNGARHVLKTMQLSWYLSEY